MTDKEKIKTALMKRAMGYEYTEREVIADGKGKPVEVKEIHKHMPPDVAALREIKYEINRGKW